MKDSNLSREPLHHGPIASIRPKTESCDKKQHPFVVEGKQNVPSSTFSEIYYCDLLNKKRYALHSEVMELS